MRMVSAATWGGERRDSSLALTSLGTPQVCQHSRSIGLGRVASCNFSPCSLVFILNPQEGP